MRLSFREATRSDVARIIDLLRDDTLGQSREADDPQIYLDAFDRLSRESGNRVIVGEADGRILATYQITFISGLSLQAARRAQIESVRVASELRGQGLGRQMIDDMEARARAERCSLIQLTMNAGRTGSHSFYRACGFTPSHVGFKKAL